MQAEVRAGRREGVRRRRPKWRARGRTNSGLGGQGTRGAHGEDPGDRLDSALRGSAESPCMTGPLGGLIRDVGLSGYSMA